MNTQQPPRFRAMPQTFCGSRNFRIAAVACICIFALCVASLWYLLLSGHFKFLRYPHPSSSSYSYSFGGGGGDGDGGESGRRRRSVLVSGSDEGGHPVLPIDWTSVKWIDPEYPRRNRHSGDFVTRPFMRKMLDQRLDMRRPFLATTSADSNSKKSSSSDSPRRHNQHHVLSRRVHHPPEVRDTWVVLRNFRYVGVNSKEEVDLNEQQQRQNVFNMNDNNNKGGGGGGGLDKYHNRHEEEEERTPFVLRRIHSVENFFTPSLATAWRLRLIESWNTVDNSAARGGGGRPWNYATNNNGEGFVTENVLSKERLETRKNFALQHLELEPNTFSYSQWELDPEQHLFKEMKRFAESPLFKHAVCLVLGVGDDDGGGKKRGITNNNVANKKITNKGDCPKHFAEHATLSDFVVTLYQHDDFVTAHSDNAHGSVVTVTAQFLVDASKNVQESAKLGAAAADGKEDNNNNNKNNNIASAAANMEFMCFDTNTYCINLTATENQLVAFRTHPHLAQHRVPQLTDELLLRFGFTAFYEV